MDIILQLVDAIKQASAPKTSSYDTPAEVVRVNGSTAWVHIPGGVAETPVRLTIDCKPGDTVQVRVGGGRAWLVGNETAPPTDDTEAKTVRKELEKARSAVFKAIDAVRILTRKLTVADENGNILAHFDADNHLAQVAGWQATDGHLKGETDSSGVDLDAENGRISVYRRNSLGQQSRGGVILDKDRLSFVAYSSGVPAGSTDMYVDDAGTTIVMDSGQATTDLKVGTTQLGTEDYSSAYGSSVPFNPTVTGALKALGDTVTALDALPSTVSDSPSGTQNIPDSTNTTISTVALNKGWYILLGCAKFASNGTGHRNIHFSLTPDSSEQNRFASSAAPGSSAGRTILQAVWIRQITSNGTSIYLNAYQTSGAALGVSDIGITALKVGD
jgi:hypothetical protein